MSELYGLFNSDSGDRPYFDNSMNAAGAGIVQNAGVMPLMGGALKPSEGIGLNVTIESGFAFLGIPAGWWYYSNAQITKALDPVTAGNQRIDTVLLRLDRNVLVRTLELVVEQSAEAAGTPTPYALVQNETIFELSLCQVLIDDTGVLSVTDTRVFGNPSGNFIENDDVEQGYMALRDITGGTYSADEKGYMLSTGKQLVANGSIVSLPNLELVEGYTYYIATDGLIGLGGTSRVAGHALGDDLFLVDIDGQGGRADAYTENMLQFNAIPSVSTKNRLKIEMPLTAAGVMIRRKTTAWVLGETHEDGDLVVDLTDDTGYKLDNEWYEDDNGGVGLVNDTTYYYKAFPYLGGAYNETFGSNVKQSEAGKLYGEWDFDSISGNVITDTANGSFNAVASGMVFEAVKVADGAVGGGAGQASFTTISMEGKTVTGYFESTSALSGIFGGVDRDNFRIWADAAGDMYVTGYVTNHLIGDANTGLFFDVYASGTLISVYANAVLVANYTESSGLYEKSVAKLGVGGNYNSSVNPLSGKIDQIRVWNGSLSSAVKANLYNGGAGC
jgi:hypothetical protein